MWTKIKVVIIAMTSKGWSNEDVGLIVEVNEV